MNFFFLHYPTLFAAAVLILSIFSVNFLAKKLQENPKKSKQRRYHPIAGTVLNQLWNFNRLHDYLTDLAAKHRTYRLLTPTRRQIYTADPANVEHILKGRFDNYGKGWLNYSCLRDLLGDGIFTVDGEKWKQQRKAFSYGVTTSVLRDSSSVVFRKNAMKLATIISEAATNAQTMDIQDLFMKSIMDSIFKVAFGLELDSMCGSSEESAQFCEAFDQASAMTLLRYVDLFWGIKKFFNIGTERALMKNVELLDNFVSKLINSKREQMGKSEDDSLAQTEDTLSRFLQLPEVDSSSKFLRDIILNFIIAGKDTTATTLSWFVYMLCKHPAVEEKIVQEIQTVTNLKGIEASSELAAGKNEGALEKMQYLHAALTETLRLYPVVPSDSKVCFSDDTLPDGYSVSKGDMVSYLPYAMGRMKFIWGEDAERFRPERWLDEDGIFRQESPFKFTAFQAGPRICLGKEFAYRQMKIFSAVLLGFFSFKLADDEKPVNYKTMINLHIDGGLHVRASHRYT